MFGTNSNWQKCEEDLLNKKFGIKRMYWIQQIQRVYTDLYIIEFPVAGKDFCLVPAQLNTFYEM